MISTRGRYAIRVLIDLAEHRGEAFTPMKEVAKRQEISLKYLEENHAAAEQGEYGRGAARKGRRLPADDGARKLPRGRYPAADGGRPCARGVSVCTVNTCPRAPYCRTLPMWQKYYEMTLSYFDSITIRDLMQVESGGDYVI